MNQWIHVEVDLDWTNRTMNPKLSTIGSDGVETPPVGPDKPTGIDDNFSAFTRMDVFQMEGPTVAGDLYVDDIELLP